MVYDFKSNSHKSKEEQKALVERPKVDKVIKGSARTRKKSELSKFADGFISEDLNNVKSYILMDVLVPSVKRALSDIIKNGIDMLLYGSTGGDRKGSIAGRVSYRDYYDKKDSRSDQNSSYKYRTRLSYEDIILESRGEAEEVLYRMDELIELYGVVRVADLYDMVGVSCDFTDNNYGWKSIKSAEAIRLRDGGYALKLPKAMPVK